MNRFPNISILIRKVSTLIWWRFSELLISIKIFNLTSKYILSFRGRRMTRTERSKCQFYLCTVYSSITILNRCVQCTFLDRLLGDLKSLCGILLNQDRYFQLPAWQRKELRDGIGFASFRKYLEFEFIL